MKKILLVLMFALCFMHAQSAAAQDIFNLTVTVDNTTQTFGFSNAEDFIRTNEDRRLEQLFPNYTSRSAVSSQLDFRGLPAQVTMAENSSDVRLLIPSLNIDKTFSGVDRDASVDDMVDFFQDEGGDLLNRIQKELVKVSAEDVLAGNPNSIQSLMVEQVYHLGVPQDKQHLRNTTDNFFFTGAEVDIIDADGSSGYEINVPIGYSIGINSAPGYRVTLQLPLSYTDIEGASAYKTALITDVQIPLTSTWHVHPHIGYGAAGSEDLASLGQMVMGGVTSKYYMSLDAEQQEQNIRFVLGNTVGYSESLKLSLGDYEFNPEVSNTYTRNGVDMFVPVQRLVAGVTGDVKLGYSYTQFFGTELFLENFHDMELGWAGSLLGAADGNVSAHYTVGDNYNEFGLRLSLAY